MTFINKKIYQHKNLTNALLRLNDALIRHDNPLDEKLEEDFEGMFGDVSSKDKLLNKKVLDGISTSGDNFEVADELYHPSTDIYDIDEQISGIYVVHKNEQFAYPNQVPEDDTSVRCTAVYRLRREDRLCAEIKNYYTLKIIDYTVTSLPYPVITEDEIESSAEPIRGSLAHNRFRDEIEAAGRIYSVAWPRIVAYKNTTSISSVTPIAEFYSVETVHRLIEHRMPVDMLLTRAKIMNMTYPTNVGYIKYTPLPDRLTSRGSIIGMYYNWTP